MAQYEGMYLKSSRLLVLVEHLYCNKNSCHKWLWKYIKTENFQDIVPFHKSSCICPPLFLMIQSCQHSRRQRLLTWKQDLQCRGLLESVFVTNGTISACLVFWNIIRTPTPIRIIGTGTSTSRSPLRHHSCIPSARTVTVVLFGTVVFVLYGKREACSSTAVKFADLERG